MTGAVSVVVERSPGGGRGMNLRVGNVGRFVFGWSDLAAFGWVRGELVERGAGLEERLRVLGLLARELCRTNRAEVTAEVCERTRNEGGSR